MKLLRWRLLYLAAFAGFVYAGAPNTELPAGMLKLSLRLRDGSLLMGTMKDDELPVDSEAIGTIKVPLSRIATIQFGDPGKPDTLVLKNGDKLQGTARLTKITVDTIFGRVSVPKDKLVEMQLRTATGGTAASVTWKAEVFPIDSDWPGDRGQRAEISDDGTILFHGRPVVSKETFTLPLTIECDLTCPQPSENDGGFAISCMHPDNPTDENERHATVFNYAYRSRGRPRGAVFCQRVSETGQGEMLYGERPVAYHVDKTLHVRLELTATKSILSIDGEVFEMPDVVVPYDRFRLRLFGWRTTDPWKVTNLTIR